MEELVVTGSGKIGRFGPNALKFSGGINVAKHLLPIMSVSYTHLTLPTNREV